MKAIIFEADGLFFGEKAKNEQISKISQKNHAMMINFKNASVSVIVLILAFFSIIF